MVSFQDLDEPSAQDVQPRPDPVSFPTTFLGEQSPTHPSVVGFLSGQPSPSSDVNSLDPRDLRILDSGGLGTRGRDNDSIHRPFVGVEGDQG